MPSQVYEQPRTSYRMSTIQVIEELVDCVFRKHLLRKKHYTLVPSPPPTLRLVMEEFPELQELLKSAA